MQRQLLSTFLFIYITVSGNKIHAILNNKNITKETSIPNIILPSSGLQSLPIDFISMSIWEIGYQEVKLNKKSKEKNSKKESFLICPTT